MSPQAYMYLDGLALCVLSLNLWLLANEHPLFEPFVIRAVALVTALGVFGHALWMFADWIPSSAGVPFWRFIGDLGFTLLTTLLLVQLVRSKRREKRRLAGIAAHRNPNLDATVRIGSRR